MKTQLLSPRKARSFSEASFRRLSTLLKRKCRLSTIASFRFAGNFRPLLKGAKSWRFGLLTVFYCLLLADSVAVAQTLSWQKQYNGPNNLNDSGVKVQSDASGNVYVTGTSESDLVTIKYNAAGVQQWAVRYDSVFFNQEDQENQHTEDQAADLLVDAAGNVYVTGTSHYNFNCDVTRVITLKYNAAGARQWKVENTAELFCADTGQMEVPHLGMDKSSILYLCVSYNSPSQAHNRIVLQKLTQAGSQVWKSIYPSANIVNAVDLYVDATGNSYIAGSDSTATGLLLKYNQAGTLQWQKHVAGLSGLRVKSSASGNVYVVGSAQGDFVTIQYDAAGKQQWRDVYNYAIYQDEGTTEYSGDQPSNLLVDAAGNVYVTGTSYFGTNCASLEALVFKYNSRGIRQWVALIARSGCLDTNGGMEEPQLAMDGAKYLYVAVSHRFLAANITLKKLTPSGAEAGSSSLETFALVNALHVDASGNAYLTGSIAGDILTQKYAASACTASGMILREYWADVSGYNIQDIPLNSPPTTSDQLTVLRTRANVADHYAQRIRGYLCAPASGNYTFFIQGDDQAELYLSRDTDPENKQRIASARLAWGWEKRPSQRSAPISLVAGQSYYLEVLHKEGSGGDQVRVGWRTPQMAANAEPLIIPGSVLSPFQFYALQPPRALSVTSVTATQVNLSWQDASDFETGYGVERATNQAGPYTRVAILAANTLSYTDRGLATATTYFYRAYAFATPGASAYSKVVSATTTTRTILREYWANVSGNNIQDVPVNTPFTSRDQLTSLSTAANVADHYAQRIRGYLLAPTSGRYTFFIQGDDQAQLWLSTDNTLANRQLIASASQAWSWTVQASQRSAPISLIANQSYYLEVLHKEGSGVDQVRVGWRTPQMAATAEPLIIPGEVLSPFDLQPAITPTDLNSAVFQNRWIEVSWSGDEYPEHGEYFVLERATSAEGPFSAIQTIGFSYYGYGTIDRDIQSNTTYYYRLYGVNQYGASSYSNITSSTTQEISTARQAVQPGSVAEVLADELRVFPNPFRERATIGFLTAFTEQARLDVYDFQGQLVGPLFEGLSPGGEWHELSFDGNRLSPGMYLVRLTTARKVSHRKLILTK